MRNLLFVVFAIMMMAGCTGNKTKPETVAKDTIDSIDTETDSVDSIISQTPMPKSADELFDDFFFNFAANRKLQLKRIVFPLQVTDGKVNRAIQKNEWKMDHFFMHKEFYTVIFDNEKQMKLPKDTSVANVIVEKVNLERNNVKQYVFERINGQFMLTKINLGGFYQSANESFLKFYRKFAVDSAYQVESMEKEVKYIGPDPDDDFKTMVGVITPESWFGLSPELPSGVIYNIIYGQQYKQSNRKIFVIRGISNGLEVELTFRKKSGKWKLVKLEN